MSQVRLADRSEPLDAVVVRRQLLEQETYPDVRCVDKLVLKHGPRAYKVATHWVIVNRNTGELHHHALKIETYRVKKDGWYLDSGHSITIEADETDVLQ